MHILSVGLSTIREIANKHPQLHQSPIISHIFFNYIKGAWRNSDYSLPTHLIPQNASSLQPASSSTEPVSLSHEPKGAALLEPELEISEGPAQHIQYPTRILSCCLSPWVSQSFPKHPNCFGIHVHFYLLFLCVGLTADWLLLLFFVSSGAWLDL